MIPTIETIVDDLVAGTISKQQAIAWLNIHAQDAGLDLRDSFAMVALTNPMTQSGDNFDKSAQWAYLLADAMIRERNA